MLGGVSRLPGVKPKETVDIVVSEDVIVILGNNNTKLVEKIAPHHFLWCTKTALRTL